MKLSEFLIRSEKDFVTISSRTPKLLAKHLVQYGRHATPPKRMSDVIRWLAYMFFFPVFFRKELDKLKGERYPVERTSTERKKWFSERVSIASEGLNVFGEIRDLYETTRELVKEYYDTLHDLEKLGEDRNRSATRAIEAFDSGKITRGELNKKLKGIVGEKWQDFIGSYLRDRRSLEGDDLQEKRSRLETSLGREVPKMNRK
jgi:hypothetical protein